MRPQPLNESIAALQIPDNKLTEREVKKSFQKGPVTTMKDLVNISHHLSLSFTMSNLKNRLNAS